MICQIILKLIQILLIHNSLFNWKKKYFLYFDYEKGNTDNNTINFYLNFILSNTQSYFKKIYLYKLDDEF